MNAAEQEEWFLANVEAPGARFDDFRTALETMRQAGASDKAEACADLLTECLAERRDIESSLALLRLRASWHGDDSGFSAACEAALRALFEDSPRDSQFIPHLGLEKDAPPAECLRRMDVLRRLVPGVLCYDKTWRLGTVREIDSHMKQFVIDFKTRPQHRMSFAYASESLKPLEDNHVLAEQHADPAAFARRIEENPGGIVKSFIRDFGPMNAPALQELILAESDAVKDWKRFWEKARKQLKDDPLVKIPAKRSDPIRLLEETSSIEDHWISSLQQERDAERIIGLIEERKGAGNGPDPSESARTAMAERLDFVLAGAASSAGPPAVRVLLLADELGFELDAERTNALIERLLQPSALAAAIRQIPARSASRLIAFLARLRPGMAEDLALHILPELALSDLGAVIGALLELGREPQVAARLRELAMTGRSRIDVIGWLCSNLEFVFSRGICAPHELAFMTLSSIEEGNLTGASVRARNKVRACFQNDEWLKMLAGPLDGTQRRDLLLRIKISEAWPESERHMLLARLARLFPDLREAAHGGTPEIVRRRLTSYRSYGERQALLRKLLEEDIPKNIKDIAAARSFGDLSENFEYHAAREMQGMLMERRKELEKMLAEVSGTSFEDASSGKAGMGTRVTIRLENGETEQYTILGEWDHDERLGIISSASKLALILTGRKPGDEVVVPRDSGTARCVVAEVSPLTDEIRSWLASPG